MMINFKGGLHEDELILKNSLLSLALLGNYPLVGQHNPSMG